MGPGGPNSSPQACMVTGLSGEPSPQLPSSFLVKEGGSNLAQGLRVQSIVAHKECEASDHI